MHKKNIEQAIKRYMDKNHKLETTSKPKSKNQKPEKLVELQVLEWCRKQGWHVSVVESKAVFSASAGRYLSGQVKAGFPDVVGLTQQGLFVAIELKAPGRRSTLRDQQRAYLNQVICRHGFGLVVDCAEYLEKCYQGFLHSDDKKNYLLSLLPKSKDTGSDVLFEDAG